MTSDGEPDIPQNLLDANPIVAFHWVLFRPVKVCQRTRWLPAKMPMRGSTIRIVYGRGIRATPIMEEGTMRRYLMAFLICWLSLNVSPAQAKTEPAQTSSLCRIETTNYKGWSAEQLSNQWLQL